MSNCEFCGKAEFFPFKCQYCARSFCGDHRLPASHNCPADPKAMNIPTSSHGASQSSYHPPPPQNRYGDKLCECRATPRCDHKYVYECAVASCKCCMEG
ncbi:MAG: AN1-type zinc finger domain-containing protein [Nitrososphaerota archaeon]|nr:AN1-type zinc finger domain-containing protein [Nitrososphaerota archaeon]